MGGKIADTSRLIAGNIYIGAIWTEPKTGIEVVILNSPIATAY
jgi:hypothetical protein